MKRTFILSSRVCAALAMIGCVSLVQAFDIAVYFDARSGVNWRSCNPVRYFCGVPRATALANIQNEQEVFDWLRELGADYVIPYYPFEDDFTALAQRPLHGMKILNFSFPGETFKYLEAQYRDVLLWNLDDWYVNDDGSSWGERATPVYSDSLRSDVLQIQTSYSDTMWRPESGLGIWNGWARREAGISGDVYMPMHYLITCNLVPDGTPPGAQPIATFYWLVKNTEGSGWWRYPGKVLTVDSFRTGPDTLDVIDFVIDPHPGVSGTFHLVSECFQEVLDTSLSHAYGRNTLDESSTAHSFGALWGVPVRMCIYYHGDNQTFQVHDVKVWDEGYHRLWVSADSTNYYDTIRAAFQQQYLGRDTLMAGWYYDEFQRWNA